jgi:hypothetical protein
MFYTVGAQVYQEELSLEKKIKRVFCFLLRVSIRLHYLFFFLSHESMQPIQQSNHFICEGRLVDFP